MTAEKLNIQPTDRSMSRMTTTNTMPRASIPVNAAFAKQLDQGARREEVRVGDADDEDDEQE